MENCENGRVAEIRRRFEQKYAGLLGYMQISISPEPEENSEDHRTWAGIKDCMDSLKDHDPRIWQILHRLTEPIDQRLDNIRKRILKERQMYSPGYRKRKVAVLDYLIQNEIEAAWYAEIEESSKPGKGGFKFDGTFVPPDPGMDETAVEILPDQKLIEEYEAERDKWLRPLTSQEKQRIDHDLG